MPLLTYSKSFQWHSCFPAALALLEMERSQYDEELSHSQKKMKKYEREKRLLEQRLRVISVQNDVLMKEKKLLTNEAMRAASYEKTTSGTLLNSYKYS